MALALAVGSLACPKPPAPPSPPPAPPSLPAAPGAPPTPGESTARTEVRAPIVRVSVRVAESFPPQYFLDVTSALPDGCSKFARTALRRDGAMLYVDVFNTQPASGDVACTMIYGEHESAVALGTDFVSGEVYTVDANGTLARFTAQ